MIGFVFYICLLVVVVCVVLVSVCVMFYGGFVICGSESVLLKEV